MQTEEMGKGLEKSCWQCWDCSEPALFSWKLLGVVSLLLDLEVLALAVPLWLRLAQRDPAWVWLSHIPGREENFVLASSFHGHCCFLGVTDRGCVRVLPLHSCYF